MTSNNTMKRVTLTAVPIINTSMSGNNNCDANAKNESRKVSNNHLNDKKTDESLKPPATKRFTLNLNNNDEDNCYEVSFKDLCKEGLKREKTGDPLSQRDPDDPFDDNNDDSKLRNIAKNFEEKYNPKTKKRKKYGNKMEDYVDKGQGYDETDPFIDNEEAYDELVPSTLTTKFGGFYINCGELEFRPLSPEENGNDDEDDIRPVIKKKRKFDDKKCSKDELNRKKLNSNSSANANSKTVAQMLQQKKIQQTQKGSKDEEILDEIEDMEDEDDGVKASVVDVIESVVKGKNTSHSNGKEEVDELRENTNVQMPENLPADLKCTLDTIKKMARDRSSSDGKRNFFNGDVNNILLDIEVKSRGLSNSQRQQMYSHLASFLPCTKQTLLIKAKKVRSEYEEMKYVKILADLKKCIKHYEANVINNYQKAVEEAKLRYEKERKNGNYNDGQQVEMKMPRRSFPWDEKMIELLNEAVKYKMNLFEHICKSQSLTGQEYLMEFLDKELRPLWPPHWMSRKILIKRIKFHEVPNALSEVQSPNTSGLMFAKPPSILSNSQQITPEKVINKVPRPDSVASKPSTPTAPSKPISNPSPSATIKTSPTVERPPKTSQQSSAEGLIGRFLSPKESSFVSVDLSTKARSSPNNNNAHSSSTIQITNARNSPVNLKSSPNHSSLVKSSSPSPVSSPLALQQQKHIESENNQNNLFASQAFAKLIEQSLGDYPNSGQQANVSSSSRNTKSSSNMLPTLQIADKIARNMNQTESVPLKDQQLDDDVIDITSSPEQGRGQSHSTSKSSREEKHHSHHQSSSPSSLLSVSNLMRSSNDHPLYHKKHRNTSLIASSQAHSELLKSMPKQEDPVTPERIQHSLIHSLQKQQKLNKQQHQSQHQSQQHQSQQHSSKQSGNNRDSSSLSITAIPVQHPNSSENSSRVSSSSSRLNPNNQSLHQSDMISNIPFQMPLPFSSPQAALQAHNYVTAASSSGQLLPNLSSMFNHASQPFDGSSINLPPIHPLFMHQYSNQNDNRNRSTN